MIGIIANPAADLVVREFFELFKTPWEYYRSDRHYEVVLCVGDAKLDSVSASLIIHYADRKTSVDEVRKIRIQSARNDSVISYGRKRLPLVGHNVTIHPQRTVGDNSSESVTYFSRSGKQAFVRVGYDLFYEVRVLLTQGQSPPNAGIPTLDLHIALLRHLIAACGITLVEIPPIPDKYPFMACLTHDVDHAFIRRHKLDRTMSGFLYRAIFGSAVNLVRGRIAFPALLMNWAAAAKLPFVYLGLARDFWNDFDRYLAIDKGKPSTFFVIPFENHAGNTFQGLAPPLRACRYDVSHLAKKIPGLIAAGCEVGVHGIDAWMDSSKGREEALRVSEVSGTQRIGVRMHWLYFSADSPSHLDEAGFLYDSTFGYNETVGYRAGTTQIFKPLQAKRMLELPLHVMDTALFSPGRMKLSPIEAWEKLVPILENTERNGGVITINWHDRSIAPERLWGNFYIRLLDWIDMRGPWFSTAAQAVDWFRRRRAVTFEEIEREGDSIHLKVSVPRDESLPPMRLRVYNPSVPSQLGEPDFGNGFGYRDYSLSGDLDFRSP